MDSKSRNLSRFKSWNAFFSFANTLTEKEKGDLFEQLTYLVLTTRPEYSSILKNVWIQGKGMPASVRQKLNLPNTDEGIDLVAETFRGQYWAIQCKFKGQHQTPTYKELSTFLHLANNHCRNVSLAVLVHTGEKGVRKKTLLGKNYTELGLDFWLGLDKEDWQRFQQKLQNRPTRPQRRKPRPHQANAIKKAKSHFIDQKAARGRLIMPCGTGKSLTAFWIANTLKSRSVIVAVPSLSLIKQSLEDWTKEFLALKENPRPEWLVICSDESTGKMEKDEFVSDTYSLGIPTTTDSSAIEAFLKGKQKGRRIIFTTYQSSERLAQAARKCKYQFDLAILDEAHKTVGEKTKSFATLLSDKNISIKKRMFMTATERLVRGANEEVFSMDDEAIYGKQFYLLTFKEAINASPAIISDYKILTITVTNEEIKQLISRNKLLTDKKRKLEDQEAQSMAAAIALRKATRKYGIKHAISFHRSIKAAENFAGLNDKLNKGKIDRVKLTAHHISSKKSAGERAQLMDDFKKEKLALMTNARCLTEGVDVPAIDCVLFADPKQSVVDIVQAAGRALRPYPGKKYGYIMMPMVIPDKMEIDEFTESTPFKQVGKIITTLSTQDERIAEEFRITTAGKRWRSGNKIIIDGSVPVGMKVNFTEMAEAINAKIWEKAGKVNWKSFTEARDFCRKLNLANYREWQQYCKSGDKPFDIPNAPDQYYKDIGWYSWGDWLGTGIVAPRLKEYRTFEDSKKFVHSLKLLNGSQWKEYCKSGMKPADIPANPNGTYKNSGWEGMGDWLGTGTIANYNKKYRPFIDARRYVRLLNIKTTKEWKEYCKSGKKPADIPANPYGTYKHSGWKGMGDWLGTGTIANYNKKYRPFIQARKYVRLLKIKSENEWREYCKSGKKPSDIPANPSRTYKHSGWKGMGDWLGTMNVAPTLMSFRPFIQARKYAQSLKLKSGSEWLQFCKSGEKPNDIPANPSGTYKHSGWKGMGDWLGTMNVAPTLMSFRPFIQARKYAQSLELKSGSEWLQFCKSGEKPNDIPANPSGTYKHSGWKGMGDWLGTGTVASQHMLFRSFNQARKFAKSLKLKNQNQWRKYCKSGKKPHDIPSAPHLKYKNEGWSGYGDWLGTGNVAQQTKIYREFGSARSYARSLNLKDESEWKKYCQSGKLPSDIPKYPQQTYKNQGWNGIGDWLGTGVIAKMYRKFRPFQEARKFVRSLKLKSSSEWYIYTKSGKKPHDIPGNPRVPYNQFWKGFPDWLGTKRVSYKNYMDFIEAKKFVKSLHLDSVKKWRDYCKSGKKPISITASPHKTYLNKGWKGWADWLGKK